MASTSEGRPLNDSEVLEYLNSLEGGELSDFEFESDSDESEIGNVINRPSDSDESDSENENVEAPRPTRRQHPHPPLFQWHSGIFTPTVHNFDNSNSGIPGGKIQDEPTALEIFQLFFSENIMQKITIETNNYFLFITKNKPLPPKSRLRKWENTTPDELFIFFAVTMLMVRAKKLNISDYWSTDHLLATQQFSDFMSRDRYLLLLRLLHFNDNNFQTEGDKLYKLRPVIDHLRAKFGEMFYPFQNICIDESLTLFKGRLAFIQYIPTKRHRFGIKTFVICDCETGYILDFIVYTGASTEIVPEREFGISGAVVKTLMGNYLRKGHTLWIDNWYSSPQLHDHLHQNMTNVCGTVRKNRKGMPKFTQKLEKGHTEIKYTDNMMALRWMDRRDVCMLSTIHTGKMINSGKTDRQTNEPKKKPDCVMAYNSNMGAVDRSDMMLSSIECVRKSLKWYRKFFLHMIDITLLNSQTLFNVKTGKNIALAEFQLKLIREIFQKFHKPRATSKRGRPSAGDQPLRLTERHFPTVVPPTPKKQNPTRHCHVCTNTTVAERKRKESRYMCEKCGVGLCVHPCFEKYHTLTKY
jgi:hypothetical protein